MVADGGRGKRGCEYISVVRCAAAPSCSRPSSLTAADTAARFPRVPRVADTRGTRQDLSELGRRRWLGRAQSQSRRGSGGRRSRQKQPSRVDKPTALAGPVTRAAAQVRVGVLSVLSQRHAARTAAGTRTGATTHVPTASGWRMWCRQPRVLGRQGDKKNAACARRPCLNCRRGTVTRGLGLAARFERPENALPRLEQLSRGLSQRSGGTVHPMRSARTVTLLFSRSERQALQRGAAVPRLYRPIGAARTLRVPRSGPQCGGAVAPLSVVRAPTRAGQRLRPGASGAGGGRNDVGACTHTSAVPAA